MHAPTLVVAPLVAARLVAVLLVTAAGRPREVVHLAIMAAAVEDAAEAFLIAGADAVAFVVDLVAEMVAMSSTHLVTPMLLGQLAQISVLSQPV